MPEFSYSLKTFSRCICASRVVQIWRVKWKAERYEWFVIHTEIMYRDIILLYLDIILLMGFDYSHHRDLINK